MSRFRTFLLLLGALLVPLISGAQQVLSVGPVHRYNFAGAAATAPEGTPVTDLIGTAHAAIRGAGASFDGTGGLRLTGGASAAAAYVDFPNGLASGSLEQSPGFANVTYELWATVHSNQNWARIFDFGTNTGGEVTGIGGTFTGTDYLILTANINGAPSIRLERGGGGLTGGAIQDLGNGTTLGSKMHLVVTYDASAGAWKFYKNGVLSSTVATLLGPDTIPDANVWLGRSNWSADANADITYDEFRVYNYSLSESQILGNYQTGSDAITSSAPANSHYRFDEGSGTTSADGMGGNAATLSGGATFVAGQIGNALNLDGTGHGRVTNNSALNPSNTMSLAAWINPANWSGTRVIAQKGANNTQYRLLAESGLLKFEIASPVRSVTAPLPTAGAWSFVVATYDGAWMRIYVNGVERGKVAATGLIPTTTDDLFIGAASAAAPASERFVGKIDDLRIYSRALGLLEIQTIIGFPTAAIVNPVSGPVAITGTTTGLRLVGAVTGALQTGVQWTKVSGPGTVTFSQPAALDTTAKFSQAGSYVLQFTDTNAAGSANAKITVGVKPAPDANLAAWLKLNETTGTSAADSSGNGKTATLVNTPTWVAGQFSNAVSFSGTNQHATLPSGIVSTLNDYSISAWVKPGAISVWSRIFDFGTSTPPGPTVGAYMNLSPSNGNAIQFAITTSGYNNEQKIIGTAALSNLTWSHVSVTLSGSAGILYVNGAEVGRNNGMTLKPSSLGNTTQNYLGKSQFGNDPHLNGVVDDFQIHRRALSASEVAAFAISTVGPVVSNGPAPNVSSGTAGSLNGSVTSETGAVGGIAWSKVSGPGTVTFGNAANAATTVTFGKSGTYVLRLTGSNPSAEVFSELTVNVTANPNIYDDWIGTAYPGVTDPAIIAPTADPDGDGARNLVEWALGMNAAARDAAEWSPGKAGLPVAGMWSDGAQSYLSLKVRRPIGRTEVTYAAEAGPNFIAWSAAVQVGAPVANGDGSETVTYRDTVPRGQMGSRFMHLKITQP